MTARNLKLLLVDDAAATAVEYGLMLVGVAAVIMVLVFSLGQKTLGLFARADNLFP